MANTLPTLIGLLRPLLNDTGGVPLWSDAALGTAIQEAVSEYGYLFPLLTREAYDVAGSQQDVGVEVATILIVGVECPPGTQLYGDAYSPQRAGSPRLGTQAWTWRPTVIRLRNPASGPEVGAGNMVVWALEWYAIPDGAIAWDGPVSDIPFLLLLAQRTALQMLAVWAAVGSVALPAGHLDPAVTLAALEVQIARETAARAARYGATWPEPLQVR